MEGKKLSIMTNTGAFGLPWLVAKKEGLFQKAGLQVEIAERDPIAKEQPIFARKKEGSLERGQVKLYSVCEWGAIQRIVGGSRGKILYVISGASPFAVLTTDKNLSQPEQLANVPVGVKEYAGSHYATIAMLEKHLPINQIAIQHIGGPLTRLQEMIEGRIRAVTLMEHYVDLARHHDAHSVVSDRYSEVAYGSDDIDEETQQKLLSSVSEAVSSINQQSGRYGELLLADVPEEFRQGFPLPTIHFSPPVPYSEAQFELTKQWMQKKKFITTDPRFDEVVHSHK